MFPDVADRVERLRRTALVQIWGTAIVAVPLLGFGAAYFRGVVPSPPPNVRWSAPLQTAKRGEAWGADDVDMLVTVEGWADDPADFAPGSELRRVAEARFSNFSATERTEPVDDPLKMQELGGLWVLQPEGTHNTVRATRYGPRTETGRKELEWFKFHLDPGITGAVMQPAGASLSAAQNNRANNLIARVALGQNVRDHAVWGNTSSSFTLPEVALRRASLVQQEIIACTEVGILLIFTAALWTRVWWIARGAARGASQAPAPTTNARSA